MILFHLLEKLKILKKNWFIELFSSYIYKKESAQTFQNFVFQLPKIYLEILVVIIILSMVLLFNQYYKYNDELFIFLSFCHCYNIFFSIQCYAFFTFKNEIKCLSFS